MQINVLTQDVVVRQLRHTTCGGARDVVVGPGPPTICSSARHTRSCVVFLQHYYMRRPGAIARARGERQPQLRKPPKPKGGTPLFRKACLIFFSGESEADNPLKNRLKCGKVPYSKKFLKNGKHF